MDITFFKNSGASSRIAVKKRLFGDDIISCIETVESPGIRSVEMEVKYYKEILKGDSFFYKEPNHELIDMSYKLDKKSIVGKYKDRTILRVFAITKIEKNSNGNLDIEGLDIFFYSLAFQRPVLGVYEPYRVYDLTEQFIDFPFQHDLSSDLIQETDSSILLNYIEFEPDKTAYQQFESVLEQNPRLRVEPLTYATLYDDKEFHLNYRVEIYSQFALSQSWRPVSFILEPGINCSIPTISKEFYKPINTLIPYGGEDLDGKRVTLYNFVGKYDGVDKSNPTELAITNKPEPYPGAEIELERAMNKVFDIEVVYPDKDKDEITAEEKEKAYKNAQLRLFWAAVKYLNSIEPTPEKINISKVLIKHFRVGDSGYIFLNGDQYMVIVEKVERDIKNHGAIKSIEFENLRKWNSEGKNGM